MAAARFMTWPGIAEQGSGTLPATMIAVVVANGNHLLHLINSILDLSTIEAGKMELDLAPSDIGVLIRETVLEMEGQLAGRPIEFRADMPPLLLPLYTDAPKLKQILINLLGNALQFTHAGFEAFQQPDSSTSRQYGGTGLGLTITRSLAQMLGYHVTVTSEVGIGTTLSILLVPGEKHGAVPSANGVAPRCNAASASSMTNIAAPSPNDMPSRWASNGRQPFDAIARERLKPTSDNRENGSAPPASATVQRPWRSADSAAPTA